MEQQNNNIEEFFLKSMEQFSDAPSDGVWNNLAGQLDLIRVPFYQSTRFWVITSVSIAASILLLWSYIYAYNSINLLSERLAVLEQENKSLEAALDSASRVVLFSEATALEEESSIDQSIKTGNKIQVSPFPLHYPHYKLPLIKTSSYSNNHTFAFRDPFNFPTTEEGNLEGNAESNEPGVSYQGKLSGHSISPKFIFADITKKGPIWKTIAKDRKSPKKSGQKARRKKSNGFRSSLASLSFYEARVGITAIASHNYLQFKSELAPGYKLGLVGDVKLSKNLDISASLNYNELNHILSIGEIGSVNVDVPDYQDPQNQISAVEWREHIRTFDFDLGFKWYVKEFLNGDKLFIHPSASIQRFHSHRFIFRAIGSGQLEQETYNMNFVNRKAELTPWSIFSATQLQIGLERQLNKRLSMQIGLWTHKKWRWYGGIGRNYSAQGIQTSFFYKPRKKNAYR